MSNELHLRHTGSIDLLRNYSRHRDYVRLALLHIIHSLEKRSLTHDSSKMLSDEFEGYTKASIDLKNTTYGTPEYKSAIEKSRPTIDLHFERNSHHPEHKDLSFLDVIEMVCDWYGAREGYADSTKGWLEGVEDILKIKGKLLNEHQKWLVLEIAEFLDTIS